MNTTQQAATTQLQASHVLHVETARSVEEALKRIRKTQSRVSHAEMGGRQ